MVEQQQQQQQTQQQKQQQENLQQWTLAKQAIVADLVVWPHHCANNDDNTSPIDVHYTFEPLEAWYHKFRLRLLLATCVHNIA